MKSDEYGYYLVKKSSDATKTFPYKLHACNEQEEMRLLAEIRSFASSFLDFFTRANNVVSPDPKNTTTWKENLRKIIEFLVEIECLGKSGEGKFDCPVEYELYMSDLRKCIKSTMEMLNK